MFYKPWPTLANILYTLMPLSINLLFSCHIYHDIKSLSRSSDLISFTSLPCQLLAKLRSRTGHPPCSAMSNSVPTSPTGNAAAKTAVARKFLADPPSVASLTSIQHDEITVHAAMEKANTDACHGACCSSKAERHGHK